MLFINTLYFSENFVMEKGDIEFDNGKIKRVGKNLSYNSSDMVIDCDGFTIVPAFIDLNCNGCDSVEATSEENVNKIAEFMLSEGVTHLCLPTSEFKSATGAKIVENKNKNAETVICDGIHTDKKIIIEKFANNDDLIVVSNSCPLCGMENESVCEFNGKEITMKNGKAVYDDGTLAGSTYSLHKAFLNMINWGIPMEKAIKSITYNPAVCLGMEKSIGTIKVGMNSDLLVLDGELNIVAVEFLRGM